MVSDTSYNFSVYPVNGDGIPASATGTNVATGSVKTSTNLWIAGGGSGTNSIGNTIAYSNNGINWTGLGTSVFSTAMNSVSYSLSKNLWIAGGSGVNTMAYSNNGINWTGLGTSVFSTSVSHVYYSLDKDLWIAGGSGVNKLVYSKDGFNWTTASVLNYSNFTPSCVIYNNNIWVASGNNPCLVYSTDGINWRSGYIVIPYYPYYDNNVFTTNSSQSISYNATQNQWIAVGRDTNMETAVSGDGITWVKSSTVNSNTYAAGRIYYNIIQNIWVYMGYTPTYSNNGTTWYTISDRVFSTTGRYVTYSNNNNENLWVACGQGTTNTLAYSVNGIKWTGLGTSVFNFPSPAGMGCYVVKSNNNN
jgi:hypothetical protein